MSVEPPRTYAQTRMLAEGYCLLALTHAQAIMAYNEQERLATILESRLGTHSARTIYDVDLFFRGEDMQTLTVVSADSAATILADEVLEKVF